LHRAKRVFKQAKQLRRVPRNPNACVRARTRAFRGGLRGRNTRPHLHSGYHEPDGFAFAGGEQAFQALPVDLAGDIDWQRVDHNNVRGDEYPCHQLPAVRTQGFRIDLFAADSVQIERLVQDHNEQMQRFGYLPLDS